MPEKLHFEPAVNRPDLLPPSINELLKNWRGSTPVEEILVTPIDPEYADSAKFCEHYGVDPAGGANCVVAVATKGESRTFAACLIPVNCRADLNNVARKTLGARRVSFAPLDEVLEETGMEYGGITPVGLPERYPILIDSRIAEMERLIIGGGFRKSKISIPGKVLAELPNAVIVEGLGKEI
ncbi:MAG TPA: YbaK/EbsC family protein [Pyrinomonadaceae bacterium]|nr:YbaK/EbsC family protein [Pyrinomonadaceae bacterium]